MLRFANQTTVGLPKKKDHAVRFLYFRNARNLVDAMSSSIVIAFFPLVMAAVVVKLTALCVTFFYQVSCPLSASCAVFLITPEQKAAVDNLHVLPFT